MEWGGFKTRKGGNFALALCLYLNNGASLSETAVSIKFGFVITAYAKL